MKSTLTLILLVGGKSSRMGQDKSALKLSLFPQIGIANKNTPLHVPDENSKKKSHDTNPSQDNQNLNNDLDFFENALSLLLALSIANPNIKSNIKISCLENQHEFMCKRLSKLSSTIGTTSAIGAINATGTTGTASANSYQKNQSQTDCFDFIFDNGVGVCEAIQMCLEQTKTPCLFIPCDTPFLTRNILQSLINAWQNNESYASYVFSENNTNKKQSLIAIYTQKAIPHLNSSIKTKMALQKAIPEEFAKIINYDDTQIPFFQNLNTIQDLNKAKSHTFN